MITVNLYKFKELNEDAKQKALTYYYDETLAVRLARKHGFVDCHALKDTNLLWCPSFYKKFYPEVDFKKAIQDLSTIARWDCSYLSEYKELSTYLFTNFDDKIKNKPTLRKLKSFLIKNLEKLNLEYREKMSKKLDKNVDHLYTTKGFKIDKESL